MKPSSIGWADYSGGNLNFVSGCTPVSESCQNCYAASIYRRYGKDFSKVTWNRDKLRSSLGFGGYGNPSQKRGSGNPICFVCDTGDLFHPEVPTWFIFAALVMMGNRSDVDWMILTKRPERLTEFTKSFESGALKPHSHIWLGVTAENQARADERIPILLEHWAGPKFVSVEPMLESVNLEKYLLSCVGCGARGEYELCHDACPNHGEIKDSALDWVICGAESGNNRRPFDPAWAKVLYEECETAGIPFFFKQGSAQFPGQNTDLGVWGKVQQWPASR